MGEIVTVSPWMSKQHKLCGKHSQKRKAVGLNAYIVSTQHGYMEGQELHGNYSENALKAVHRVRDGQETVCKLLRLRVFLVTYDYGAPLQSNTWAEQRGYISRPFKPIQHVRSQKATLADPIKQPMCTTQKVHKQIMLPHQGTYTQSPKKGYISVMVTLQTVTAGPLRLLLSIM